MIACGLDGWSRGNHDAGVSLGHDIRQYLPLDLGAFDQQGPKLARWFEGWMGSDYAPPLETRGWFWEGHKPGVHIWSPPPAGALVALNQLLLARQNRPMAGTHVFVCQRLQWQEEWRKRFEKEVDLWFILHTGTFSPHDMFEPLLIGISFPLSRNHPWLV